MIESRKGVQRLLRNSTRRRQERMQVEIDRLMSLYLDRLSLTPEEIPTARTRIGKLARCVREWANR